MEITFTLILLLYNYENNNIIIYLCKKNKYDKY